MYKIPVMGFGAGLQKESLALYEPWLNSCTVSCCAVKWFSFVQWRGGIQRLMEEFGVWSVSSILERGASISPINAYEKDS